MPKELTRGEEAEFQIAAERAAAAGEELDLDIQIKLGLVKEVLTTRTALEVICQHISGKNCMTPLKPEKVYEFFQFDKRVRNTMNGKKV